MPRCERPWAGGLVAQPAAYRGCTHSLADQRSRCAPGHSNRSVANLAHRLTLPAGTFVGKNLVPSTIGNLIGGSVFVGTAYAASFGAPAHWGERPLRLAARAHGWHAALLERCSAFCAALPPGARAAPWLVCWRSPELRQPTPVPPKTLLPAQTATQLA